MWGLGHIAQGQLFKGITAPLSADYANERIAFAHALTGARITYVTAVTAGTVRMYTRAFKCGEKFH